MTYHPILLTLIALALIAYMAIAEILCPLLGYAFGAGMAYRGRAR
jgi:hypothetical protein